MKLTSILLTLLTITLLPAVQATAAEDVHTFAETSALAEGSWVKVQLDGQKDGVYQISYSQLRSMGFSQPEKVGVYGFGGHALTENLELIEHDDLPEVATYHDTKRGRILFYGQGLAHWNYDTKKGFRLRINSYEDKAYYFLLYNLHGFHRQMCILFFWSFPFRYGTDSWYGGENSWMVQEIFYIQPLSLSLLSFNGTKNFM